MARSIIAFIWIVVSGWHICFAQSLDGFKYVKVLSGESIDVVAESMTYPEYLRRPKGGAVSKFKFGYEDVYRIRYQSQANFVGLDTVIYRTERRVGGRPVPFFEGFVVEVGPVQLQPDYFHMSIQEQIHLPVIANDETVGGNSLAIRSINYVDGGEATISKDGRSIVFVPNRIGYAHLSYTACADGVCGSTMVNVRVEDPFLVPKGDSSKYQIDRDGSLTFIVGEDFAEPRTAYYQGDLLEVENRVFAYQAPLGFVGSEVLKFNQIIDGKEVIEQITINIVDPFRENGWNADDQVFTEVDNPIRFSIVENDLGGTITSLDQKKLAGALVDEGDGTFLFTPDVGFRGQTMFSYETCLDGRCDVSEVLLTVHNYEPLYDQLEWFVGSGSVLDIGYDVPIDDYRFSVASGPQHGQLEISDDGSSLRYKSNAGYVGTDFLEIDYCVVGQESCVRSQVRVVVQDLGPIASCDDCVWPGDHNADGMVDAQDAVVLATNLGVVGPSRSNVDPTIWVGLESQDWPARFNIGTPNHKHVDSNGDGIISLQDIDAVSSFYGRAHSIIPTPPLAMDPMPLFLNLLTPDMHAGDLAVVQVVLGQSKGTPKDMLGMNFSFEASPRFVDSSSLEFRVSEGGLLDPVNSVLSFAQSPHDGRIEVGIGKTDGIPITGHGVLGEIRFIVEEDLNGFRSLKDYLKINISLDRIALLSSNDELASLPAYKTSLKLLPQPSRTNITIAPNPASESISIYGEIAEFQLFNLQGSLLKTGLVPENASHQRIDVTGLHAGLYVLHLRTKDGNLSTQKIEIIR